MKTTALKISRNPQEARNNTEDDLSTKAWNKFDSYSSRTADESPASSLIDPPILVDREQKRVNLIQCAYPRPGEYATMTLEGPLFSDETHMKVNGVKLTQSSPIPPERRRELILVSSLL